MKRLLFCVSAGAAAVFAFTWAGDGLSQDPAADPGPTRNSCRSGDVETRVKGKTVCLREGQACRPNLRSHYARHGFVCANGVIRASWKALRRPLRIPRLAPGVPCPASKPSSKGDLEKLVGWGRGFPAWGTGPGYPLLLGDRDRAVLDFPYPPPAGWGSEWSGDKVLWFVAPTYEGRLLIRGRQLDGLHDLRFENGRPGFTQEGRRNPASELRLQGSGSHPATTRVRAAGCYAFQVDGRTLSIQIVFEARLKP